MAGTERGEPKENGVKESKGRSCFIAVRKLFLLFLPQSLYLVPLSIDI